MKGFLTAHDRIFRKTHDFDELASAGEAVDPTPQAADLHQFQAKLTSNQRGGA